MSISILMKMWRNPCEWWPSPLAEGEEQGHLLCPYHECFTGTLYQCHWYFLKDSMAVTKFLG